MTEQSGFDWEAQRQRSREQGELLAEVRRRDGDACRVCGVVVDSSGRESSYSLNYRILDPGTTLTVAGVVVVCRAHLVDGVVQAAPLVPFYTEETAEYDAYQDRIHMVTDVRLTAQEATEAEADGYPCPISGDPVVTVQDAINRGAIHVTRGLPVGAFVNRYGKRTAAITALAATQRRLMVAGRLTCSSDAGLRA